MVPFILNSTNPLSALFRAQQQDRFSRIPLWVWILVVFVIVVIVGIIVTLREEEEADREQVDSQPVIPPAPKSPQSKVAPKVVEADAHALVAESEPVPAAEAAADVAPTEPAEAPAPVSKPRPDNLKRISGIGPKIEKFLKNQGITTFAELAEIQVSRLQSLIEEAGWENLADPTDWPDQARKLAQEK